MKKLLIVAGLLLSSCGAQAQQVKSFMPETGRQHPVWEETGGGVTQDMFDKIIQAGLEVYSPIAAKNKETLVINNLWQDGTINANACRGCEIGKVIVNMFGGLARDKHVINEGFTLVLCHEIGHLYAGVPYISTARKMSAEGQSDYYSTGVCYAQIAAKVPELKQTMGSYDPYSHNKCYKSYAKYSKLSLEDPRYIDCLNSMEGGLSLGRLLASLMDEPEPKYETPDTTVVTKTVLSYPRSVQCRTDTYAAGALKLQRPRCWFKP